MCILSHVYLLSKYLLWCMFSSFAYLKFVFMFLNYCVVRILHIFQRKKLLLAICSLNISSQFVVWLLIFIIQSLSRVQLFLTPWTAAHWASLSITSSWSLLKLMSIKSVCHPTISSSVIPSSSFSLSQHQGLFQWVSSLNQVAKILEFQLQHQSSNEHSGLISFRRDWLDLLVVQGTLKNLLQHHSSKAPCCSSELLVSKSPYFTFVGALFFKHGELHFSVEIVFVIVCPCFIVFT